MDGRDAAREISARFRSYNEVRPHSSLGGCTPGEIYRGGIGEAA